MTISNEMNLNIDLIWIEYKFNHNIRGDQMVAKFIMIGVIYFLSEKSIL